MLRSRGRTILGGSTSGGTTRTASGGSTGSTVSSPMSMGELITAAESNAAKASVRRFLNNSSAAGYGKTAAAIGKNLAERAVLGRLYVGSRGGLRTGGYLVRGIIRLSRSKWRYNPIFETTTTSTSLVVPPGYTKVVNCGPGDSISVLDGFTNCPPTGVVKSSNLSGSGNSTIVHTWKRLGIPYGPNPAFEYCTPGARYTRPSFPNPGPITVSTTVNRARLHTTSETVPYFGTVGGWAPGFNEPASFFEYETPTQFNGSTAPWSQSGSGSNTRTKGGGQTSTDTTTGPGGQPVSGVQTFTPPVSKPGTGTPPKTSTDAPAIPPKWNPPVTTLPGPPPPSRPPGPGTKEVKFGGSKILVRILKIGLSVTEGIDAMKAISEALPQDKLKQCKKAARKRYYDNKASGANWGTVNWQMTPQEQALCVWNNLDSLDMNHVFYNLVKDQIEDLWAGWQYGLLDKQLQISRPLGGPTSTKTPFDHATAPLPEWDSPFWDEVASYLKGKGL